MVSLVRLNMREKKTTVSKFDAICLVQLDFTRQFQQRDPFRHPRSRKNLGSYLYQPDKISAFPFFSEKYIFSQVSHDIIILNYSMNFYFNFKSLSRNNLLIIFSHHWFFYCTCYRY